MKTTIDIPEKVLKEAMRNANASTKRDAVIAALEEYNRRRRVQKAIDKLGTSDTFMTPEALMQMREVDNVEKHQVTHAKRSR